MCVADFISCGVEDSSPVIVFVSKLFAMDKEALPQHEKRLGEQWRGRERGRELVGSVFLDH